MISILRFVRENGRVPFDEWMAALRDQRLKARILLRLQRLQLGDWGDAVGGGAGAVELRIHEGAGYRIYCGRHGDTIVILLGGGEKKSQSDDLRRAKLFWTAWKRSQG